MSAFIVSDETMHRVVLAVCNHPNSAITKRLPSDPTEIGNLLFKMNRAAIWSRYGERRRRPRGNPYVWKERAATLIEQSKAIGCLLYQCSEGNIPERPLFKALSELDDIVSAAIVVKLPKKTLRLSIREVRAETSKWEKIPPKQVKVLPSHIVSHLPEYRQAPWDF